MHLVLVNSIAFASFALAQNEKGPYTITYLETSNNGNLACNTRQRTLSCRKKPAFDCCEAPPGRQFFTHARATSDGTPGIVSFHSCVAGGVLNACYNKSPFEPVAIFPVDHNICETIYNDYLGKIKRSMDAGKEKLPLVPGASGEATVPKVCSKVNAISIQGVEYHLAMGLNNELMKDFRSLSDEEMVKK
jgi:hypothetical protein